MPFTNELISRGLRASLKLVDEKQSAVVRGAALAAFSDGSVSHRSQENADLMCKISIVKGKLFHL